MSRPMSWSSRAVVIVLSLALAGCELFFPSTPAPTAAIADWCYLLQPRDIATSDLAAAAFDGLVLEPSRDGRRSGEFTAAEIAQIQTGGAARKIVLAYLSIGEAEDYRDYWNPAWVDGGGRPVPAAAPAWLGPLNPDWPGNYKVRYWDPAWQALLFGTPGGASPTPLDRIIDQGFDGVYMDIVDAYEYWSSDDGGNELSRMTARERMIDLIVAIANYARNTRGRSDFRVFPQNAADIIRDDNYSLDAQSERYFAAISGIGQEDLWYSELDAQSAADTDYVLDQLSEFRARNKTVLVVDYVIDAARPDAATNAGRVGDLYAKAAAAGFSPYAALSDRALDEIVQFSGPGWTVSQPRN